MIDMRHSSRRHFLKTSTLSLGAGILGASRVCAAENSERSVADSFDTAINGFMKERNIPGGALAVTRNDRIVYARGYGWADRENNVAAGPDTLFRIASLSKPITAVAVLRLVERGKIGLEDHPYETLGWEAEALPDATVDPRLKQVTVLQLLQHTGGWDRDRSFDPMFRPGTIARAVGKPGPPGPRDVIRYMLGQPLDFDPGQRYAYSNFGYCVLGRLIEKATGQTYEQAIQQLVLKPAGVSRMRLGASLVGGRAEGETHYYMPQEELADNVFPEPPPKVPWPYGGFYLEAMDAHGGWIASATDLAKLSLALRDPSASPVLSQRMFEVMSAPPPPPAWRDTHGTLKDFYYGCGWSVRPQGAQDKANLWHTGSLPGTYTIWIRRVDGLSFVALFNQRTGQGKPSDSEIDPLLNKAANAVTRWPETNL